MLLASCDLCIKLLYELFEGQLEWCPRKRTSVSMELVDVALQIICCTHAMGSCATGTDQWQHTPD
jgi:hypothetical protein